MRHWRHSILLLGGVVVLMALGQRFIAPRPAADETTGGESTARNLAAGPSVDPAHPRLYVLAINGGGAPHSNYQSHLSHLKGLLQVLHGVGVPAERITVLAGDGSDPTPDIVVRETGLGDDAWRLQGTAVEELFRPYGVMGNSEVTGATLYPATHGSLSVWMMTVGQQLRAGDTLLLYVTDHGTKGSKPEDNRIVLWGDGQGLSVRELRDALETLDESVRIVAFMSQCYSGAFASLLDLGGTAGVPTGRFCGFFSTTADRPAYGCYPETRDDPKVGHSFAFLQALPAAAGRFALAHELALEFDDTPDVPLRTSDLYVGARLRQVAAERGIAFEQLVDEILARAWGEQPGWNLDVQRVDRLAAQFGLPTSRRRAAVATSQGVLAKAIAPLEERAGELDAILARLNRKAFQSFLADRPHWRSSLESARLKLFDPAPRLRLGTTLAAELADFSRAGGDHEAQAVKRERDAVRQLLFRTRIRMAALGRVETLLDAFAAWLYLADHPAERDMAQRLVDCEALELALPKAEWVDPGPALPAWDEEMALMKTMVGTTVASRLPGEPAARLGVAAPALDLVPYHGQLPSIGAGKPLLLFFWATWCKPCKAVVPDLMALTRERHLDVLAITDDSEANLERFFAVPREFPSWVARDPNHQAAASFGVRAIPTFVLLDGQGRVASPITNHLRELPAPRGD